MQSIDKGKGVKWVKKRIVAIYDREEGYAKRLTEIFNSKNRMGFQAEMFTSAENLWNYSRQQDVEILLVGDSVMESRLEHCASMILVISEGTRVAELDKYEVIFKYQSSELIIQKVLEVYGKGGTDADELCKPNMRTYGVFAPQARGIKSAFAWNLAKYFAREKSVLYINLTAFLGRMELYGAARELADIMYYVHNGFDNLIYLVGSAVSSVDGIDCMPPMKSLDDLVHVPGDDWVKLLQVIISQSHYEVLILDVEECVQQFYRLLAVCNQVLLPTTAWQDKSRWELCEQYFERVGVIDVWKQAKRVALDAKAWRNDMENIINA